MQPAIDSLQEVVDNSFGVKVAIPDDVYSDILVTSPDPIHQRLYKKQIRLGDFRAKVTLCLEHTSYLQYIKHSYIFAVI